MYINLAFKFCSIFSSDVMSTDDGTQSTEEDPSSMEELIPPLTKKSRKDVQCVIGIGDGNNTIVCDSTKHVDWNVKRINCCESDQVVEKLVDIIKESADWILDIDLDFFSTGNPFKSLYTKVYYT